MQCGCQGEREDKMGLFTGRNTQLWVSGKWAKDNPGVLAQSVGLLVEFQELAESAGEGGGQRAVAVVPLELFLFC